VVQTLCRRAGAVPVVSHRMLGAASPYQPEYPQSLQSELSLPMGTLQWGQGLLLWRASRR